MKKRNVIILTDISTDCAQKGEPDDTQSLVRALLYTDQLNLMALVATYTPHVGRAAHEYLLHVIEGYGKAYPNLAGSGFAEPDALSAAVARGDDHCGEDRIGMPSEAAHRIVRCIDASEEPVWILAWGGVTDLAQAVALAQKEKDAEGFGLFMQKLRVYAIGDQYDACGPWIRQRHPDLFYIVPCDTYRGMYRGGDASLCDAAWVRANVISAAPLGEYYPLYSGGDLYSGTLGRVEGMKEGDSPSLLHLVDNGLNDAAHPEYGGWGGRHERLADTRHFSDAFDYFHEEAGPWCSVSRWRADYQADFAARLALAAGIVDRLDYPVIRAGQSNVNAMEADQTLTFAVQGDENDALAWTLYPEAGTYKGMVLLRDNGRGQCTVTVPSKHKGGEFHLIASATRPGRYPLKTYMRFIVSVV